MLRTKCTYSCSKVIMWYCYWRNVADTFPRYQCVHPVALPVATDHNKLYFLFIDIKWKPFFSVTSCVSLRAFHNCFVKYVLAFSSLLAATQQILCVDFWKKNKITSVSSVVVDVPAVIYICTLCIMCNYPYKKLPGVYSIFHTELGMHRFSLLNISYFIFFRANSKF